MHYLEDENPKIDFDVTIYIPEDELIALGIKSLDDIAIDKFFEEVKQEIRSNLSDLDSFRYGEVYLDYAEKKPYLYVYVDYDEYGWKPQNEDDIPPSCDDVLDTVKDIWDNGWWRDALDRSNLIK